MSLIPAWAATLYVQIAGSQDATTVLSGLPGVSKVTLADRHDTFTGYEVEAEPNRDIRTDVARAVVQQGLGLLELRPTRITLEEIFLQLTTEDLKDAAPQVTGVPHV